MKLVSFRDLRNVFLCLLLVVMVACSGVTESNQDGNGDNGQSIMVVSERAYRNGAKMDGANCQDAASLADATNLDWDETLSGMVSCLLDAINREGLLAGSFDWNTAMASAGSLAGDPLAFIRNNEIFLVYRVRFDEASGVAIVDVEVHQGNPYDPNSQSLLTVSGTSIVGEILQTPEGGTVDIGSACMAFFYAGKDAVRQLIAQNFLSVTTPGNTPGNSSGNEPESTDAPSSGASQ